MFKPTKPQHIVNKGHFDSKIPEPPTQDGFYALKCGVSRGQATYIWAREAAPELPTVGPNTGQSPSEVPTETP